MSEVILAELKKRFGFIVVVLFVAITATATVVSKNGDMEQLRKDNGELKVKVENQAVRISQIEATLIRIEVNQGYIMQSLGVKRPKP